MTPEERLTKIFDDLDTQMDQLDGAPSDHVTDSFGKHTDVNALLLLRRIYDDTDRTMLCKFV